MQRSTFIPGLLPTSRIVLAQENTNMQAHVHDCTCSPPPPNTHSARARPRDVPQVCTSHVVEPACWCGCCSRSGLGKEEARGMLLTPSGCGSAYSSRKCMSLCLCVCARACVRMWLCVCARAYVCVPVCVGGGQPTQGTPVHLSGPNSPISSAILTCCSAGCSSIDSAAGRSSPAERPCCSSAEKAGPKAVFHADCRVGVVCHVCCVP